MSGACLEPELTFGCIRVSEADRLPLAMVNVVLSESEASITFMGDNPAPWDAEICAAAGRARHFLGLPPDLDAAGTVKAVYDQIEDLRGGKDLSPDEMNQWSVGLGVVWADALCAAGGWEWRCISTDVGGETYGVCSPDRSHAVHPTSLMHCLLAANSAPNNTLLLFNMILSGDVPQSAPAAYTWLE